MDNLNDKDSNEEQSLAFLVGAVMRSCINFAEDNGKCWWGRFKEDKDYSMEQLYEMWLG
jgi:hypothetical protein